jgi:hypothetical protein
MFAQQESQGKAVSKIRENDRIIVILNYSYLGRQSERFIPPESWILTPTSPLQYLRLERVDSVSLSWPPTRGLPDKQLRCIPSSPEETFLD